MKGSSFALAAALVASSALTPAWAQFGPSNSPAVYGPGPQAGNGTTLTPGEIVANSGSVNGPGVASALSAVIDRALGSAQGDILYRGSSGWVVLVPGGAGQELLAGGSGANPAWATVERGWGLSWSSTTTVATGTYPVSIVKNATIEIDSVDTYTGGTSSPGFGLAVLANGATICGGGTISVGTTDVTTTCGNTLTAGETVDMQVVSVTGTPDAALTQINWHVVAP